MTAIAFDLETYLIQPGTLAPKAVCASFFDGITGTLERFTDAFTTIEQHLASNCLLVGANVAFDFAVVLREKPALTRAVFEKYERGEVWDVLIAATLHAIADGRIDDRGMVMDFERQALRQRGAEGTLARRFSLENTTWLYLKRANAKENDEYRLKYGLLDALPTEEWPAVARQYPVDDAVNTFQVYKAQKAHADCMAACGKLERHNWTQMTHHSRAALGLHLSSVWGVRTDPSAVADLERKVNANYEETRALFQSLGFVKKDGKDNGAEIKRRVVKAYTPETKPCEKCKGTGRAASEKTKNEIKCKACDGTGFALSSDVPRTAAGGISADRQTLRDCGDPDLDKWADAGELDKLRETYLPFFKQGTTHPINVRSNVLVASGRTSYEGLIQLIPSKGGARECFVARPGRVWCSVDYAALELCTLAQVTLNQFKRSKMAETINRTKDPGALHTEFAAQMAGATDLEAFAKAAKVKGSKEAGLRQMAKAANFGFPGLMGPVKFVLAKRREGLRLCEAAQINAKCTKKTLAWGGKTLDAPACPDCLDTAAELRKKWFTAWPEIQEYFQWVSLYPGVKNQTAKVVSPLSGYIRGGLHASNLANHPFQHLAAMGAKHALWKVTQESYCDRTSPLYGSRPVMFVHDEIISEMRAETFADAGPRMAEVMVNAMRDFVPDVYISAEPAGMWRWDKRAETRYDSNGRLIPWSPPVI